MLPLEELIIATFIQIFLGVFQSEFTMAILTDIGHDYVRGISVF